MPSSPLPPHCHGAQLHLLKAVAMRDENDHSSPRRCLLVSKTYLLYSFLKLNRSPPPHRPSSSLVTSSVEGAGQVPLEATYTARRARVDHRRGPVQHTTHTSTTRLSPEESHTLHPSNNPHFLNCESQATKAFHSFCVLKPKPFNAHSPNPGQLQVSPHAALSSAICRTESDHFTCKGKKTG